MRQECPDYVRRAIPPELSIEYWCRRALFEVIEELSDTVWWSIVICVYANGLYQLTGMLAFLAIGLVLCIIWPGQHLFFEILRWRNEIHVVTRNEDRGGGMYFKFSGGRRGMNRNVKKDPITDRSPSPDVKQGEFYRIWGFFTGERMVRYSLKSDNNQFIDGRKVSPALDSAVDRVRLASPRSESLDLPDALQWVRELRALSVLRGEDRTVWDIETIINQQLYGVD